MNGKSFKEEFIVVGVIRNLPCVWVYRDSEQYWNVNSQSVIFIYLIHTMSFQAIRGI
jgi:hypothetical protein